MEIILTSQKKAPEIKIRLPITLHQEWKEYTKSIGYTTSATIRPVLDRYLKGDIHPDEFPYFKSAPLNSTEHTSMSVRVPAHIHTKLKQKTLEDEIKLTSLIRSIIEYLLID